MSSWPSVQTLRLKTGRREQVLFYDKRLMGDSTFKSWKNKFKYSYSLQAGEDLKSFASYELIIKKLLGLGAKINREDTSFVAVGGGSVGDFVGFVASTYKRGVNLVHIPTTWLSAMDSSHGGKTALNFGGIKNQVGTFYPSSHVFLVKEILKKQHQKLVDSALGEFVKYCFLNKDLFQKVNQSALKGQDLLWKYLKEAVDVKYKIIQKDPYETKKVRAKLNLGHSVGHVLEAHYHLDHGTAVGLGLQYSLEISRSHKLISRAQFESCQKFINSYLPPKKAALTPTITPSVFLKLLQGDKKLKTSSSLNFIFIQAPGRTIVRPVLFSEVVKCAKEGGWTQ